MAAVDIEGLRKEFGPVVAVDDVSFSIDRGEVFGLLGPNGAGKTTLLRCLLGYLHPTRGRAMALGGDARAPGVRAGIGYLPGDLRLEPRLTPRQIASFHVRLLAHAGRAVPPNELDALGERLALSLDRRFGTLSKGNRQKVGVLLAMLGAPDLLVLDEPTSGLDPLMQDVVLDMVRERRDAGAAVLLSTHILTEAASISHRVGMLSRGQLVTLNTVRELLAHARQHLTFTLESEPPVSLLAGVAGVQSSAVAGNEIDVVVTGSVRDVVDRLAPWGVVRIHSDSGELDEVFHASTDDHATVGDRA